MKRIIAIMMALIVVCSLAACTKADNGKDTTNDIENTDSASNNNDIKPADLLTENFNKAYSADKSAEEIANEVITDERLPWMCMVMPVEEGFLSGFKEEIGGFEEAATFGPVIGSIPFVGYIFKLASDSDVEAFTRNLKDNADPSWNICVTADETICLSNGNTVFFTMCPAAFED